MQRLEFGVLVALLRGELGWTQAQLAENANIELSTLSNLERGAKKIFDPDLLVHLADALQLTSLERREFFLAASGLDQRQIVRQPDISIPSKAFDHATLLKDLSDLMAQMLAPSHLGDVFGDVIIVNRILLEVLQIDAGLLLHLAQAGVRINNLQIAFDTQIGGALNDNPNQLLISLLRAFREGSLRYRLRRRYSELMQDLKNSKKYPLFDRYWRRVSTIEEDKVFTFDPLEIEHKEYGKLRFMISSSVILTSCGELFLSHYFPLDIVTASAVIKISEKVGRDATQLSAWPGDLSP